jgi:hypothetical protein
MNRISPLAPHPKKKVGVEQNYGKFIGIHEEGLQLYNCLTTSMTPVSLATQQLICSSDCKTKDNVTLTVRTAIQYKVEKNSVKVSAQFARLFVFFS